MNQPVQWESILYFCGNWQLIVCHVKSWSHTAIWLYAGTTLYTYRLKWCTCSKGLLRENVRIFWQIVCEHVRWILVHLSLQCLKSTVDGREIWIKSGINNGICYQPKLVSQFSSNNFIIKFRNFYDFTAMLCLKIRGNHGTIQQKSKKWFHMNF